MDGWGRISVIPRGSTEFRVPGVKFEFYSSRGPSPRVRVGGWVGDRVEDGLGGGGGGEGPSEEPDWGFLQGIYGVSDLEGRR